MNKIENGNLTSEPQKKYFILNYKLIPDILNARIPFKEEHMSILNELSSRGLVFVGWEVVEGFPAMFMFESENDDIIKEWLKRDPYFNNGLVAEYHYNQIILVAGNILNQK